MSTEQKKLRPVIVSTIHRFVFFGYASDTSGENIDLKDAKMAIYWGTTKGLQQLACSGPTDKSRISEPADLQARGVTLVIDVTPEAEKKWRSE